MLPQTAQARQTSRSKRWRGRRRWARALPGARGIPGDAAWRPPAAAPARARQKQHSGNCSKGRGSLPAGFLTGGVSHHPWEHLSVYFSAGQRGRNTRPQRSLLPYRALLSLMLRRGGGRGGGTGTPRLSSSAGTAATDSYYGKSLHSCAKQSQASAPPAHGFPTICSQTLPMLQFACKTEVCIPTSLISQRGVLKLQVLFATSILKWNLP